MVRKAVKVSPKARRWFLNKVSDVIEVNSQAAEKLIQRFKQFRENLGEFSGMGVAGDIPGTRRVVRRPYVVTIRVKAGLIEVVAIRNARQGDAYSPEEAHDNERQPD
jgi:plasmid stabilization system protein ParE